MIERVPGWGRYSATEREQRWLMGELPDGVIDPVDILDKYLEHSTLRLRRMYSGASVVYKLGQKVRHDASRPSPVQMTNMYLTATEFGLLDQMAGSELHKTRWHWKTGGRELAVDVFSGCLDGLILAEVELEIEGEALPAPAHALSDVTDDDRLSGGSLARLTPSQAQSLLDVIVEQRELRSRP